MTNRTVATPSTEITVLVTPTTLVITSPVSTIASAIHGPLTRAARVTDDAASTTAAAAASPMINDASPGPPAPTSPARVTSYSHC